MTFIRGQRVRLRGSPDRIGIIVSDAVILGDKQYFKVQLRMDQPSVQYPEDGLEPIAESADIGELMKAGDFAAPRELAMFLTLKKLEKPLSDNLYTFYSSRTEFQVHQFKPVLKFNRSEDKRLLIADEVGLGKTIEAGIILTEHEARVGKLDRVLIVCPAALTRKWKNELYERFGLDFEIVGRPQLLQFLERYRLRGPDTPLRVIASIETLRSASLIDVLRDVAPSLDIVIIDEAHHFRNPDTYTSDVGQLLSENAEAMLMLTATPLQLRSYDLFNLFSTLLPEEFENYDVFVNVIEPNQYVNGARSRLQRPAEALTELRKVEETELRDRFINNPYYRETVERLALAIPLSRPELVRLQQNLVELNSLAHVFNRTKKSEVGTITVREPRVVRVELSPSEMGVYDAVTRYVEENFLSAASGAGISFARIMPQRQVASCVQTMKEYARDIVGSGRAATRRDWEGEDLGFETDDAPPTQTPRQALRQLVNAVEKLGDDDSKFDRFLEAIQELERQFSSDKKPLKILVFSFFKRTLEYLFRRLERSGYTGMVEMVHGDVPPKLRDKKLEHFASTPRMRILLSSDVGSEGVDLQFCNVMFNYDLPWNPMRVEQRIGRIDRFGQQSEKVLIYNFSIKGTIDELILERLYERIGIFERYIGDLEAILGTEVQDLTQEMLNPRLSEAQRGDRLERLADALERQIQMMQQFEEESLQFLGQDEYFTQEVSSIQKAGRFISATEVRLLLESFLALDHITTGATLKPVKSGANGVYVLKADEEFTRFVRYYTEPFPGREDFVRELEIRDGGVPVTFDSKTASANHDLTFITIHHPLIKAIARYVRETQLTVRPIGRVAISGLPAPPDDYVFLIYLLEESSLKHTLRLVPVLVSLKDRKSVHLQDDAADQLIGRIPDGHELDESIELADSDVDECMKLANEYMAILADDEEKELVQRNSALIDARIDTKRRAYENKVEAAKRTLQKVRGSGGPESIQRIYRSRINKFEEKAAREIAELEAKRGVNVGFSLVSGGLLRVIPEKREARTG